MRLYTTSASSCLAAAAALCVLLLAHPSGAQQRGGRIEGTIYDDEGMPMAGAAAVLTSPTQIGGARRVSTGGDGSIRFMGLIPGVFQLKVSKAGFVGVIRKGIRVHVNKTVTLDILLEQVPVRKPRRPTKGSTSDEPGAPVTSVTPGGTTTTKVPHTETYVITAARPVVDVTKAATGESLSDDYVESVPMSTRSYQGMAGMTRSVTQKRDAKGSGQGNPSVSGGAYFNNTYMVDGMDTTDPVTHTFATNFNFDAMSDVNIMTGGMGPEFSDTPGGVINMVTKSGSNDFEVDSSLYYQDDAMTIKRLDEKGSTFRNLDFNLNVGGPLIRDRLWYYASVELNHTTGSVPPDPNQVLPDHPARVFTGVKVFTKLTWQLNPKHKLLWWFQGAGASIANREQLITVEPDAEGHQDQYSALTTVAHEWLAGDKTFVKTQLGFAWTGLRRGPESGVEDVPRIEDIGTGVKQRNYNRTLVDDRYRISLNSDVTRFFDNTFGDHEVKAGFRYQHVLNPSTESYTGNTELKTQFGKPYSQTRYYLLFDEDSACDATSPKYNKDKCSQGKLSTSVSGNKLILFAKDTWKVPGTKKRLRLIPGVAMHYGNTVNPDGEEVSSFVTATGHLNFAWDVFGDGKTVLRGGYNQYVDVGFLSLARFIGRDLISNRCNWDDSTQAYTANCRVGGQTRTVGLPQGPETDKDGNVLNKYNPDFLTIPRVHEATFGAEREWFTGFSTGVDFQFRYYANQWEDLETNVIWNEAGDNSTGFKNGKSEFIYDLETPEDAWRRYMSVSLFARRFVGNWQVMASYTFSRNEGTVSEGFATTYLDRPRQVPFFEGPLPDDRTHVVKVSGWYRFRRSLSVGGSFWVGTGTPYDKLFFNSFFGDYNDRRAPRGVDPGDLSTPDDDQELRMPTRVALDIKVSYKLADVTDWLFGEAINLELMGEVFNAFNLRTETRYEDRNLKPGAATQWGDIIDRQNPFRVRVGMRYRY